MKKKRYNTISDFTAWPTVLLRIHYCKRLQLHSTSNAVSSKTAQSHVIIPRYFENPQQPHRS